MTGRVGVAIAAAAVIGTACTGERADASAQQPAEPTYEQVVAGGSTDDTAAAVVEDAAAAHARLQLYADSVDRKLRRVPGLTTAERRGLRRDVNEQQLARARQIGLRVSSTVDPLVQSGRLVRLADTTDHWAVRELDYSLPYVTPDAEAMLNELGRRFHARLDSLGVPRYRLDITSVLRTPATQAELRRRNANASRTESSHEFGTTLDIAYRRYAPPHDVSPAATRQPRFLADSMLVETARLRGAELQAVLGRVILEMQQEGKLMVMMERRQTVYHITVARRFPRKRT